ncbi:hypothetical protein L195_g006436, partial [Trifolium pratense]
AKGLAGHAFISYTFLDLPAFVERWHETNNFHMSIGKITLTLNDVSCLMHIPFKGRLMDHPDIINKAKVVDLMVNFIRSNSANVDWEATSTGGTHA